MVFAYPSGRCSSPRSAAPDLASASVICALQQLTPRPSCEWQIWPLDQGDEFIIYAAQSGDRGAIWETHNSLIIKVYRPEISGNTARIRAQFDGLSRAYAALNGSTINGWSVSVPAPIYLCDSPLALVMTMVPGRRLLWHLEFGNGITHEILSSLSYAVGIAMSRYWSLGQPFGDLNFDNVLCEVSTRALSFVDPSLPHNPCFGPGIAERWYPASHDLANLLYVTVAVISRPIPNRGAHLRKLRFVEGVLGACIGTVRRYEDKRNLLDEVQACARAYLRVLEPSLTPSGIWRVLLRLRATRKLDKIFRKLRAELYLSQRSREPGPAYTAGVEEDRR